MSREPKPYFRKATQRWVCTIDGKRITLGSDKKAAHDKLHELMLNRSAVASEMSTLYELSQAYLDWCVSGRLKPASRRRFKTSHFES